MEEKIRLSGLKPMPKVYPYTKVIDLIQSEESIVKGLDKAQKVVTPLMPNYLEEMTEAMKYCINKSFVIPNEADIPKHPFYQAMEHCYIALQEEELQSNPNEDEIREIVENTLNALEKASERTYLSGNIQFSNCHYIVGFERNTKKHKFLSAVFVDIMLHEPNKVIEIIDSNAHATSFLFVAEDAISGPTHEYARKFAQAYTSNHLFFLIPGIPATVDHLKYC